MSREPAYAFDVTDAPEQELRVVLEGADVARFDTSRLDGSGRSVPHPIAVFAAAAGMSMFRDRALLADSVVTMRRTAVPGALGEECIVSVVHVAPSALRVLSNMLRARDLDRIVMQSVAATHGDGSNGDRIDLSQEGYPPQVPSTSFVLDYKMPERMSRDRLIQLEFTRTPSSADLERVYTALEIWTMTLMLGGYPGPGQLPVDSAAAADRPFLALPRIVRLAFPDLFLCDDDCFALLVNWAERFHQSGCSLERVTIR